MNFKFLLFTCVLFLSGSLYGQRNNLSAFSNVTSESFNPASIGWEEAIVSRFGIRSQWVGLEGSPQLQFLSIGMPLQSVKSGVGLDLSHSNMGVFQNIKVGVSYNYKLVNKREFKVGAGLKSSFASIRLNKGLILTPDGLEENGVYDFLDGRIDLINSSLTNFSLSTGVDIQYKNYEFGLVFVNSLAKQLKSDQVLFLNRHYICNLDAEFDIVDNLVLKPSILLQTDFIEWQAEALVDVEIIDNYNVYIGMRGANNTHNDAVLFGVGSRIMDRFHLGYIFEYGISKLADETNGSHEIMLTYKFGQVRMQQKRPAIIYAPIYL